VIGRGPKAKGPAVPKPAAEGGTPPAHLRVVPGTASEASDAEGIRRLTGDLVADMDEAMREAGIAPGEPMAPLLAALKRALAWQGEMTARNAQAASDMAEHTQRILSETRQAADAEIERERATISADKAAVVRELSDELLASTRNMQVRHVRVFQRNSLLSAAGILAAAVLLAALVGYRHGVSVTETSIEGTVAGLEAAFKDGPASAATWLRLMRANDPVIALAACTINPGRGSEPRRACALPMWLDVLPIKPPQ